MPDVIGIRFKKCGKVYDFEINGNSADYKKGDFVVVESELGLSLGRVINERRSLENPAKELKKVLRKATEEDFKKKQENEDFEKEAGQFCLERIMARGLSMKLILTETTLDRRRIIFYFTADGRIDFREIVKDLAAKFKTRIEMRQIGVRDEAKIIGGLGICGRELCCKTFLTSFEPISIKMAKQQELVLNMSKLSGVCGRLMCCLGYECPDEESAGKAVVPQEESLVSVEEPAKKEVIEERPRPEVKTPQPSGRGAEPPKTEAPKDRKPEETPGHKKRKKRRWRKFQKQKQQTDNKKQ